MAKITINNFNKGGLADSVFSGVEFSLAEMVGLNIHGEPGVTEANQKMTEDSAASLAVDEFVKVAVSCSDGNSYWFSADSGKIWKRTSGGTFSLADTTATEDGEAKCLGVAEYEGYIYWATERRLHRIKVSSASASWSTDTEEDWKILGLDVDIGSTGAEYTLTTGVDEGVTHRQTFVPSKRRIKTIIFQVDTKGTGDYTATLHDSDNNVIATATIVNASLPTTGNLFFTFSSAAEVVPLDSYHVHVESTVADGKLETGVASDLEDADLRTQIPCDTEFHPMKEQRKTLYIGNVNFIDQVFHQTFTSFALDLPEPYRIKCLGNLITELLIGTGVADTVNKGRLFRWNGFSISWSGADEVPEPWINSFLETDNFVLVNAGLSGNVYSYDGNFLVPFKKIPGDYSPTKTAWVHPEAKGNFKGIPIFGFSNKAGNPSNQGIYSLGKYASGYPIVLNLEFPISTGNLNNIEVGTILVMGNDILASFKDTTSGTVSGVDALDYTAKYASAYFVTRSIEIGDRLLITIKEINANYKTLPANTDIPISHKKNDATSYTAMTTKKDSKKNFITAENRIDATSIQFKVAFTVSGNNTPALKSVLINLGDQSGR